MICDNLIRRRQETLPPFSAFRGIVERKDSIPHERRVFREKLPELFTIETDQLTLVWSRRRAKPVAVAPGKAETPFGLAVQALRRGIEPVVRIPQSGETHLFEQTDYTLFAQSKRGVRVRHRDPVLVQGLQRSDEGRVVHGVINFGTQVGQSRFVVEAGGVASFEFVVEVFPSKLDYRRDYEALREDVQEIAAELVLEYLRATYKPGWEAPSGAPGAVAWMLLLRHVVDDLEQALAYVARQPQWGTRRTVEEHRADRIRRPDAALRRAVQRGRGRGAWRVVAGLPVRERLPGARGQYTLDTPEHRWLAARLALIRARLADLHAEEARRYAGLRRRRVLDELEDMQHRIARLTRLAVIEEAEGAPPEEPPLRLLTAPGYREAYRACLRLHQGLSLEGGPHRLGLKELHLLYEYWCFLTLVRLAAEAVGRRDPLRSLIAVEQSGLRLRLRKGRVQTVAFPLASGRRLDLTYNPRFGGRGYLVPQQPDLLLTLHRADGAVARYVLDAKYRLDASPSYRKRYGLPGPPTDALNDLHRYRDAIRDRRPRHADARAVVQAVALYPYREEETGLFEKSRHRRMIDEIGVGAIPLLPGETAHLEAWLRGVLKEG